MEDSARSSACQNRWFDRKRPKTSVLRGNRAGDTLVRATCYRKRQAQASSASPDRPIRSCNWAGPFAERRVWAGVTLVPLTRRAFRLSQSCSGERSEIGVISQYSVLRGISLSGRRSKTACGRNANWSVSFLEVVISLKNIFFLHPRAAVNFRFFRSANARTGEISITLSVTMQVP